jgi:hypothetical protein|tara:strand:+ start:334 stop:636 length:303 start_codon:yes stop_codon:yes gene_type:complete
MRDTTNYTYFLNVKFNIKRNPEYKGSHELARIPLHTTSLIHTTFDLGTTEQDMIDEFHAELVNIDINGKTWLKGEMVQVVSIEKCFEDRTPKGRFHKDNY